MTALPPDRKEAIETRLGAERNVWLTTLRPDGSPHVTPIWFTWDGRAFWMCTSSGNVKVRNLRADPRVALALEDGDRPIVAEGAVTFYTRPYPAAVIAAFRTRFDWDITATDDPDGDFEVLLEVVPTRWLLVVP